MQVERAPMPVFQKIIYLFSFIFLIAAFIYLGTKNFNAPVRNLTDQESFTKEFGITSDNVFKYKTGKEILETMNTGTAVIFFAFPENMWSHTYADMLNEVAKYFGIEEIYYYNFKNDRSVNNSYYENIVDQLDAYLPTLDTDIKNLYAPTLILVKDGEIIAYDDETSILHGSLSVNDYWTMEKQEEKKVEFGVYFQKFLEEDYE